jgi:hypothetical protein
VKLSIRSRHPTQSVIVFLTGEGEKVASVERLSEEGEQGEENGNCGE